MKVAFTAKRTNLTERLIFICLLAIFSLSLYFKPISYFEADWRGLKIPDFSVFHYFGFYGPTCGLTRSFINLAHGRLIDGFLANFMGPIVFVMFFLSFCYLGYRFFGGKKRLKLNLSLRYQRILTFLIVGAFLVAWFIRLASPLKSLV